MPSYRIALDLTTRTIERRARYFRNLIVTVVIVGVIAVVWALLARSLAGLMGAAAVFIPICGVFILADHLVLDTWRADLLASWVATEIDFAALASAIRVNPALPKNTAEGMLATLPSVGDLTTEQRVPPATRQAIAARVISRQRSLTRILACRTLVAALGAAALVAAVASGTRSWLLWVLPALAILMVGLVAGRAKVGALASTAPPSGH